MKCLGGINFSIKEKTERKQNDRQSETHGKKLLVTQTVRKKTN
jgi:hypothetical protein